MLSDHLEKLHHFAGIVKAGSIRNYALQSNLSQSAMSKCIQILEGDLEATLLIRSRDGVKLTSAGRELFDFAEEVHSLGTRVEAKIKSNGNIVLGGKLVMGTYQSIAIYFIPKFFKFLQMEQKNLRLDLVCATSLELIKMVKSGKIDFAISIDPPASRDLFRIPIFKDTYSLYRKVGTKFSSVSSAIYTLPLACDENGKSLAKYIKNSGVTNQVIACGDFEVVKAMIESDIGYGLLPERVALTLLNAGKFEKVPGIRALQSIGPHNIMFCCRKQKEADSAIQWICNQLILMLKS